MTAMTVSVPLVPDDIPDPCRCLCRHRLARFTAQCVGKTWPHPELNEALLRKTVDFALHDPRWFQNSWYVESACGTTMCLAGYAVVELMGYVPVIASRELGYAFDVRLPDGSIHEIYEQARRELGLTYDEASGLFNGDNNRHDVILRADVILSGKTRGN